MFLFMKMGAAQSKTTVQQLSEAITTVSASVVQRCIVGVKSSQTTNLTFTNTTFTGNATSVKQTSTVSSQCFQDASLIIDLQNKISEAVKNVATAGGVGFSSANSETNLKTLIENNITAENVQEAFTSLNQNQNTNIRFDSSIITNNTFDITQGADVFAASVLKVANDTGLLNVLATTIDAGATAKGVSLADLLPSTAQLAMIAGLALCVLVGIQMIKPK